MPSHKTPLGVVKQVLLSRQQADDVVQWQGTGGAYLGGIRRRRRALRSRGKKKKKEGE